MSAYCPECETDLDPATGICPACRWDPYVAATAQAPAQPAEPEMSLTERYRGTRYDVTVPQSGGGGGTMSRGRTFVLVSLVAGAGLYALCLLYTSDAADDPTLV